MDNEVQVKFGADASGVRQGADEAKDAIHQVGDKAAETGDRFDDLGKKVLGAFAVDKIIEFIGKMADLGEQIERLSILTGESTDAVQEFQFAVKMTGGDAESAAQALLRFENNLGKAQEGTGPAAQAYKQLGIELRNNDGTFKTTYQILGEIADRFSETADGARKVEYATALGSRGFAQLIPVLDQGRGGLEKLNVEFDRTGGKLSKETVDALVSVKHGIIDMWEALKGAGAEMVAMVSGPINLITKSVEALGEGFKQDAIWIEEATQKLKEFMGTAGHDQWGGSWSTVRPATVDKATFLNAAGQEIKPQLPELGLGNTEGKLDKGDNAFLDRIHQNIKALEDEDRVNKLTTQHIQRDYEQISKPIERAFDGMLQGILSGTEKWRQAISRMFTNLAASFIDHGVHQMIDAWVKGEAEKTAATMAGNEERMASDASANSISAGFGFARMLKEIEGAAATTYAGVFAFMSPLMGPFAAIPAGAAAALVGGMAALVPSFDVGTFNVPSDMLANIHKGEMIIPAQEAQAIREGDAQSGGETHLHFHGDIYGFANFQDAVAKAVQRASRNFSPRVPAWKA